jgi:branched-chain amino acid transport system ATP-binding protein
VVDNVILAAGKNRTASALSALLGRSRSAERERAMEMLALVGIADRAEDSPSNLPLGFLKRLEVARALALDPKVLMLDEPLAGLNHAEARALADTIRDINAAGRTLVLIEHNLGEVMRICHRLVVLDNGRRIGEGDPKTVMSDPVVRAAYLGEGGEDAAA